ncbi:MAG: TrkA family potassium uptake protein [Pseudomonadales bacterium]
MRAVFVGASAMAVATARALLKRGQEVVIVERDKTRIDSLADELACGFIHGDGTRPAILQEADASHTDVLFCMTGSDQANIIASLVGRSLHFKRVVTRIEDIELEHICLQLGLEDTIVPSRTIARYLADLCEGRNPLELSTMIRDEARAFSFVVRKDQTGPLKDLELPEQTRVICVYRGDQLLFPDEVADLQEDDEVVLVVHRDHLEALQKLLKEKAAAEAG